VYKGSRSYTRMGFGLSKMWCSIEECRKQEKNYVVGVPKNFLETYCRNDRHEPIKAYIPALGVPTT